MEVLTEKQFTMYQYPGAIHIHTKFSDGTGDVNSISKSAKKAGLNWIIITDHNSMEIEEGIFNGVYVIKGEEISPENRNNHYLALGTKEHIIPSNDTQTNVDTVRNFGGFGFAAHPDEGINGRKNQWEPIVWQDKNIIPDGVEIWNWFSNWADNLNDKNIFKLVYSYLFKNNTVSSPYQVTLSWWDKLNNDSDKIVPSIGGVDAHALKIRKYLIPLTIFPYKSCFKTITNVISLSEPLSKNFEIAKEQILQAIKCGNNIIINRKIYEEIPQINISNNECCAYCGQSVELSDNTVLNICTNRSVEIRLIQNGKLIDKIKTVRTSIPIKESGKYRLEFFYNGKIYAFTNPINVI